MTDIYLDHNSTTPIAPEVAAAMDQCHRTGYLNPASQHGPGRAARRRLEEARVGTAEILGAKTTGMDADQVIFTSGGTEANNLALLGLCGHQRGRLIISGIEHPSIVGPAEELQRRGWELQRLRVSTDGVVDLDHLRELLCDNEAGGVVSVMLGNNETGVLQPVRECRPRVLSRPGDEKGVVATGRTSFAKPPRENIPKPPGTGGLLLHTDAVQVAGKLPIDFRALGVDAMTVSAHKFHGPRGIGALIVRHGVQLQPILHGGFQQAGLRPGTEDVALAVGMCTALRLWQDEADQRIERMTQLRDSLEQQLLAGDPSIVINGAAADRLPHTSNISFLGLDRQAMLMALDLAGVACSTGSACASGSSEPSPVLLAMRLEEGVISGALRLSLGATTTPAEIDEAARRILRVVNDLRRGRKA